ncbi:unnamed protein product [Paramecium octaurelia]|uniref:Uncharacterized protein n=1 Tax=Paramecium octaurelia TaxID=43137 RepID=A0A8S1X339_PAROT|nr:unnamed protein product [Paramecium octaurelia]CAD8196584.1 unnamed protein product [Paramecium octaurelia]
MSTQASMMEFKCVKLLKTQGDQDGVIPDSDQEEKLKNPYNNVRPKSCMRPRKRLRFSRNGTYREMSTSQIRQTQIPIHSILKTKGNSTY